MKKKIESEEQHVKNGEQEIGTRRHDSRGFGPTVYADQVRGREVDEVEALRTAADQLTDYIHAQWEDDGVDAHQLEQTVSALLDVVLMWQARVPSAFELQQLEQPAAEEAVRS